MWIWWSNISVHTEVRFYQCTWRICCPIYCYNAVFCSPMEWTTYCVTCSSLKAVVDVFWGRGQKLIIGIYYYACFSHMYMPVSYLWAVILENLMYIAADMTCAYRWMGLGTWSLWTNRKLHLRWLQTSQEGRPLSSREPKFGQALERPSSDVAWSTPPYCNTRWFNETL